MRLSFGFVAAAFAATVASASAPAQPIPGKNLHLTNVRDLPFCEIEVATGRQPDIRVQFNNTTGASDCPLAAFDAIDPAKLARTLHADRVVPNPRRHWMMDEMWVYRIGATTDFDGVRATWMGSVALKDFLRAAGKPYAPIETNRASSMRRATPSTF
jgi:hypothetical protein